MRRNMSEMVNDIENIVYEVKNDIYNPKQYTPFKMSDYITPQHAYIEEDVSIQDKVASDNKEYEEDLGILEQIESDNKEYEDTEVVMDKIAYGDNEKLSNTYETTKPIIESLHVKTNMLEKIAKSKDRQFKEEVKAQPQKVLDEYNKNYPQKDKIKDTATKTVVPEALGGVTALGVNKALKRKPNASEIMKANKSMNKLNKDVLKNYKTMSPDQARKALGLLEESRSSVIGAVKKYTKEAAPGLVAGTVVSGIASKTLKDKIRDKRRSILEEAKNNQ